MIRSSLDFNATINSIKGGRREPEDFLMVKRQNPSWLCKLGFHKWKDYGESVVVVWEELHHRWKGLYHMWNGFRRRPRNFRFRTRSKAVSRKKKCLRCGTSMKRILVKNVDGTLSSVGWEILSKSESEKR